MGLDQGQDDTASELHHHILMGAVYVVIDRLTQIFLHYSFHFFLRRMKEFYRFVEVYMFKYEEDFRFSLLSQYKFIFFH